MEEQKRGPGRPKTITDMKAYKRDKMREYRSAKKAKLTDTKEG